MPDHIRNAILALIGSYQGRGSINLDELNAGLPTGYDWTSRDIDDVFELVAESGLRIEE